MKHILLIAVFAAFCIIIIQCTSQKKIDCEMPAGIPEAGQTYFLKQFEEGKTLYAMSCAQCHNTTVRRKQIVPDFSPQQLEKYNAKFRNPKHMGELKERNVSNQELQQIFFYLKYKKKNVSTI